MREKEMGTIPQVMLMVQRDDASQRDLFRICLSLAVDGLSRTGNRKGLGRARVVCWWPLLLVLLLVVVFASFRHWSHHAAATL